MQDTPIQQAFVDQTDAAPVEEKFAFSLGELYDQSDEEQKWLIDDLIPRGIVNMLIGPDGIGKTQILTQLCLHIAMKRDSFLGLPLTPIAPRCIVAATEDDNRRFASAIKKQMRSMQPDMTSEIAHTIDITFIEGCIMNNMDEFISQLTAEIKKAPTELIITDAIGDLFGLMNGNINDNDDARALLGKLSRLCSSYDVTIIGVHHVSKGKLREKAKNGELFLEKDDTLGAGALSARPRNVLALTHDKTTKSKQGDFWNNYLHLVKTNFASHYYERNAIELEFNQHTLLHTFKQTIDIEAYNNGDGSEERKQSSQPRKGDYPQKAKASQEKKPDFRTFPAEHHQESVLTAFNQDTWLTYDELVSRLKFIYQIGETKIRSATGLIRYLIDDAKLIFKFGPNYQMVTEPLKQAELIIPEMNPSPETAEDLPF